MCFIANHSFIAQCTTSQSERMNSHIEQRGWKWIFIEKEINLSLLNFLYVNYKVFKLWYYLSRTEPVAMMPAAVSMKPTVDLLEGMKVLARREKDGYYCPGTIKEKV